jgi:hypothetical protein
VLALSRAACAPAVSEPFAEFAFFPGRERTW